MHSSLPAALAASLALLPLSAQAVYSDDADPTQGSCSPIPFGDLPNGRPQNYRWQLLLPGSLFPSPTMLLDSLAFAACGNAVRRFGRIRVRMDVLAATSLSRTFASNLSPNALTVLDATDRTWRTAADRWSAIGLGGPFPYNATAGGLVIDIEVYDAQPLGNGDPTFHHGSAGESLFAAGWTGSPPATGTPRVGTLKVRLGTRIAAHGMYGVGCATAAGTTPSLDVGGDPVLGGPWSLAAAGFVGPAPGVLVLGPSDGPPLPAPIPGSEPCLLQVRPDVVLGIAVDAAGSFAAALNLPRGASFIGQRWFVQTVAVDPAASRLRVAVSNYAYGLFGS